jgi:mono/diheme cytochrome c family protein
MGGSKGEANMPKKLSSSLAGFWLLAILASAAMAADAGKAVFDKSCASCHGADGKGNPAMTKVFGEKELNIATKEVAGKKDDDLLKVIVDGKGKMPAAGKTLSKSDQKAVIEHVRSLAK